MFAVIVLALMGVLAIVAPRHGVDSRPGFTSHPTR
ncbi:MAG: hypothetical protein JWM34_1245 [Ilumatobacteraceae bacterium]|nr:hypothetical protein [Ilumatobacteraceae bacterium]